MAVVTQWCPMGWSGVDDCRHRFAMDVRGDSCTAT